MYFVTSDIHSYFTIFKKELDKQHQKEMEKDDYELGM